jgi:hypothetical protein
LYHIQGRWGLSPASFFAPDSHESGFSGVMNKQTEPKQLSVARILINQLVFWPCLHVILGFLTCGIWLLFGWVLQIIDLCMALNNRAKYAKWQHEQLLEALRAK